MDVLEMLQRLSVLRDRLKLGGVDEGIFELTADDLKLFTEDEKKDATKWLKSIYNLEGRNALKTYRLVPPNVWKSYEGFEGSDSFEEVAKLREQVRVLRTRLSVKERPKVFRAKDRRTRRSKQKAN